MDNMTYPFPGTYEDGLERLRDAKTGVIIIGADPKQDVEIFEGDNELPEGVQNALFVAGAYGYDYRIRHTIYVCRPNAAAMIETMLSAQGWYEKWQIEGAVCFFG